MIGLDHTNLEIFCCYNLEITDPVYLLLVINLIHISLLLWFNPINKFAIFLLQWLSIIPIAILKTSISMNFGYIFVISVLHSPSHQFPLNILLGYLVSSILFTWLYNCNALLSRALVMEHITSICLHTSMYF